MPSLESIEKNSSINWDLGKTILITEDKDKGLYSRQFKKACDLIDNISERWFGKASIGRKEVELGNTVIGVSGERGSGKTSFLYSLEKMLPDNVYSLGCVDPASFSSEMNALEIFLAQLYSKYKDIQIEMDDHDQVVYSPAIHKTLKKVTKSLATLHMDKGLFANENPSIELLENMTDLQEMRDNIQKLCQEFLGVVNGVNKTRVSNKNTLLILFDDVDLTSSEVIYRLLEDVRKYLSGNLIVVVSYRQRQLFDSVLDSMLKENEVLLKRRVVSMEQIKARAEDFIAKVLYADRTIVLLNQVDLLERNIVDVFASLDMETSSIEYELITGYLGYDRMLPSNMSFSSDMTVHQWIDAALYCKTLMSITPVNTQENTVFLWPRNLRELVSFVGLIHDQMSFPDPDEPWSKFSLEKYDANLSVYKNLYLMQNLEEVLDCPLLEVLHRWNEASAVTKNYVLYEGVFSCLYEMVLGQRQSDQPETNKILNGTLCISQVYPENVTIGDVYDILMRYIKAAARDKQKVYFGTSLKTLCSIELLTQILQMLDAYQDGLAGEERFNDAFVRYVQLLNSTIISPSAESPDSLIQEISIPSVEEWDSYLNRDQDKSASFETRQLQTRSFQECKQSLLPFISPLLSLRSKEYRVSRPEWQIDEETRRLVPKFDKQFRDHNNRFLFPKAANSLPDSLKKGRYSFCVLNLFARSNYINNTVANVANTGEGGYLFYSLMDLDVFTKLTYDEKQSSKTNFLAQMRRINSALAYSSLRTLTEKAAKRIRQELKDDEAAIDVSIPFEIDLFPEIKSPFVKDRSGRYRPFSDEKTTSKELNLPTYVEVQSSLDQLERVSLFSLRRRRERASEERERTSAARIDGISDEVFKSKSRAIDYLSSFVRELNELVTSERDAELVRTLEKERRALIEPSSRLTSRRKLSIERVMRSFPLQAEKAYRNMIHE